MIGGVLLWWATLPRWAKWLLVVPVVALALLAMLPRAPRALARRLAFDGAARADDAADSIEEEQFDELAREELADEEVAAAGRVARTKVEGVRWDGEGPYVDDGEWGPE